MKKTMIVGLACCFLSSIFFGSTGSDERFLTSSGWKVYTYTRQFTNIYFIENSGRYLQFDQLLNQYFKTRDLEVDGIPAVAFFAQQLRMSPKYLGDKLRVLTGKTAQEHIYFKVTEQAKILLLQKRHTVAEVAYRLGFEYPPYFSRFFKKRVGVSPTEFQRLN